MVSITYSPDELMIDFYSSELLPYENIIKATTNLEKRIISLEFSDRRLPNDLKKLIEKNIVAQVPSKLYEGDQIDTVFKKEEIPNVEDILRLSEKSRCIRSTGLCFQINENGYMEMHLMPNTFGDSGLEGDSVKQIETFLRENKGNKYKRLGNLKVCRKSKNINRSSFVEYTKSVIEKLIPDDKNKYFITLEQLEYKKTPRLILLDDKKDFLKNIDGFIVSK